MFTNNRDNYREAFFIAWEKYQKKLPLDALQTEMITIMLQHPDYYSYFENPAEFKHQEFTAEENPFIHLSLHLAINEQIRLNRPQGVAQIQQELIAKYVDEMEVTHRMMACLAEMMFEAQETGAMPGEEDYLQRLKGL